MGRERKCANARPIRSTFSAAERGFTSLDAFFPRLIGWLGQPMPIRGLSVRSGFARSPGVA